MIASRCVGNRLLREVGDLSAVIRWCGAGSSIQVTVSGCHTLLPSVLLGCPAPPELSSGAAGDGITLASSAASLLPTSAIPLLGC